MSLQKLKNVYFLGSLIKNIKGIYDKVNEIIDYLNGLGTPGDGSYKVYIALLTQSGTDAPIAIVLENTLGGTPDWSYSSIGDYRLTLNGVFDNKKVFIIPPSESYNFTSGVTDKYRTGIQNINSIYLLTGYQDNTTGALTAEDEVLYDSKIEIRVYN